MGRQLFGASFKESQGISPNLLSKNRPISYSLGSMDSDNFFQRLSVIILVVCFSVISYGFGGFLPKYVVTHCVSDDD